MRGRGAAASVLVTLTAEHALAFVPNSIKLRKRPTSIHGPLHVGVARAPGIPESGLPGDDAEDNFFCVQTSYLE